MQDLGDLGEYEPRRGINNAGRWWVGQIMTTVLSAGVRAFLKNRGEDMQNLGTLGDGGAKPSHQNAGRWRELLKADTMVGLLKEFR